MTHLLSLVSADAVRIILEADPRLPLVEVTSAYREHHRGTAINPPSQFLRFPDSPNRVVSLLAAMTSPPAVGCKIIASWPDNTSRGRQRAAALIALHNPETGYPHALLDGSRISIARTTASAVLGARHLASTDAPPRSISVVGAGAVAASLLTTFACDGWSFDRAGCYDLDPHAAHAFALRVEAQCGWQIKRLATLDAALEADIVAFTTTAATPYIVPPYAFRPGQIVLNISLRDIAPELLLAADNIVDDPDHCLREGTSPHLAEQLIGDRRFITGTLGDLMAGTVQVDHRKPLIFSPFGLGILDLALARAVWRRAEAAGRAIRIENFIGGEARWG